MAMSKNEKDMNRRATIELAKYALENKIMNELTIAMCLRNGGYSEKLITEILDEIRP